MEMRNSFPMAKGSHSGGWQAWVYILAPSFASGVASDTVALNFTKADNDMTVDKTVDIQYFLLKKVDVVP